MIEREQVGPDGQVTLIRLAHGPVNAMGVEVCGALAACFAELEADDDVTAVVLTGRGAAFSAGADLRAFLDGGPDYAEALFPNLAACLKGAFALTKPVVAAVNGHALAGGCVLASAADLTLMAEGNGRIGLPELPVGVPFPRSALEVMQAKVGGPTARRMVLEARGYKPGDAMAMGLVDQVVPPEDLVALAVEKAAAFATTAPADTFSLIKRSLRREFTDRIDQHAEDDAEALALWSKRSTDGWTAAYLERVTGK